MNALPSTDRGDWIKRLPPLTHQIAILVSGFLLVMTAGAMVGFGKAVADHGTPLTQIDVVIFGGLLALAIGLGWLTWRLTAIWRRPGRSAFEQRYTRMWLLVLALGLPGGIALGLVSDFGASATGSTDFFSNAPLVPGLALAGALILGAGLIIATVVYHRTVDDHEERAYLWGSSVAFHFLVTALPVAWLLSRGGWIDPLGTGAIAILLIASVVLQGAVALWLKYR